MHLKALIPKTSVGNVNSALNINAIKSVLKLQLAMIAWEEKTKKQKSKQFFVLRKISASCHCKHNDERE